MQAIESSARSNGVFMGKVRKAVIPVAGFGTRFLPFTKAVPKMMLPVIDKPVLQIIVEEAIQSGIEEILFIVGRHADIIESYFTEDEEITRLLQKPNMQKYKEIVSSITGLAKFSFVVQTEQMGTAHAVSLAEEFVGGEPFLLMFGDDLMYSKQIPVSKQLIDVYCTVGKTVIGCKKVPFEDVPKYATVELSNIDGRIGEVSRIVEKPSPSEVISNLAPLGRYVCCGDIFDYIRKTPVGKNGEYQITDTYALLAKEGKLVSYEFEGVRYDTGDKLGYLKAVVEYSLRSDEFGDEFKKYLEELVK